MLDKFLHEVVSLVAGSGTDKIVAVLFKKKNVNEFLIAKKLNVTINQARNILYKLADEGLVYFNRKKDSKSGGWYTYFWTLDEFKCMVYYRDRLLNEIDVLQNSLSIKKTKQFYVCKTCGMEVTEEAALLYEFTCPECGEVFSLKDSADSIVESEKQIQKMKDKISEIQSIISEMESQKSIATLKIVSKTPKRTKKKPYKASKKPAKKKSKKRKK